MHVVCPYEILKFVDITDEFSVEIRRNPVVEVSEYPHAVALFVGKKLRQAHGRLSGSYDYDITCVAPMPAETLEKLQRYQP
jgi:hypothetical protein